MIAMEIYQALSTSRGGSRSMTPTTDRVRRRGGLVALALLAILVAGGCGRRVTLVPVSGVVEVCGRTPRGGVIGPDGRFTLSTFEPGDGVMPGRHKVVVNASKALSGGRVQWLVSRSMRTLATTPLEFEVSGPTDEARISISTAREKPEIEIIDVRGDTPDPATAPAG